LHYCWTSLKRDVRNLAKRMKKKCIYEHSLFNSCAMYLGLVYKQIQQNEGRVQCYNKKTNVQSAPPLDWLWYKTFDYLFASIVKIDEVPHGKSWVPQSYSKRFDLMVQCECEFECWFEVFFIHNGVNLMLTTYL
jgi:hypothetical protein